jgi:peptidoglycan hydrolase CwlO-like protein
MVELVVGLLSGIGLLMGLYFAAVRFQATPLAAQNEAKDAIIATWQKNAEADKARIATLESNVQTLTHQLTEATKTIARLEGQVDQLEKFSAPEAVERFEQQQEVIIAILRAIAENAGVQGEQIRGRGL